MSDHLLKRKRDGKYFQRVEFIRWPRPKFFFTKDPFRGKARTFRSKQEARKYNFEHKLGCEPVPKYKPWENTDPYLYY